MVDVSSDPLLSSPNPLHQAVRSGHLGLTRSLLNSGKYDTNSKDFVGQTPLHLAGETGSLPIAIVLVLFGAKTNVSDKYDELKRFQDRHFSALQ